MRATRAALTAVSVAVMCAVMAVPAIGQSVVPGTITDFPVPANSQPVGVVQGPDGAMWVTANDADRVFRMTTDGQVTNTLRRPGHRRQSDRALDA
jgi:virginiamycin B lyase